MTACTSPSAARHPAQVRQKSCLRLWLNGCMLLLHAACSARTPCCHVCECWRQGPITHRPKLYMPPAWLLLAAAGLHSSVCLWQHLGRMLPRTLMHATHACYHDDSRLLQSRTKYIPCVAALAGACCRCPLPTGSMPARALLVHDRRQ